MLGLEEEETKQCGKRSTPKKMLYILGNSNAICSYA